MREYDSGGRCFDTSTTPFHEAAITPVPSRLSGDISGTPPLNLSIEDVAKIVADRATEMLLDRLHEALAKNREIAKARAEYRPEVKP